MLPPSDATPEEAKDGGSLPDDTTIGGFNVSKANALTTRAVAEAGVKGILGLPALADDAGVNAAYYGKKLLSKTGLVDAPDPANYGLDQGSFPATSAVQKIAEAGPDALGLRRPTSAKDRMVSAVGEGALGAAAGVGAGTALRMIPAAARAGGFLADAPVAQVASGALSGGAGEGAQQLGAKSGASTAASLAAGALPFLLSRGRTVGAAARATDTTTERGIDNAAARVVQRAANNPAQAAENIRTGADIVPGTTPSSLALAGDTGLNSLAPHLKDANPAGHATMVSENNAARVRLLENAGFNDPQAASAAYAHADATAAAQKPAVLNNAPPMAAQPVLDHFARIARDPNQTTAVQEMAQAAREEIRSRLEPLVQTGTDAQGNPIYAPREIRPQALEAAKTSFAAPFTSKAPSANMPAYAMHTRAEVFAPGGAMDAFTHHIDQGAPGYQRYLEQQAALRSNADELDFGNALIDRTRDAFDDGVPSLSPSKFGNALAPGKIDTALSPGNRMTMERMRQTGSGRAEDIDRVRADIEREQLVHRRGNGSVGSNTVPKAQFTAGLRREADAGLPLRNRVMSATGGAMRVAGPAAAAILGPLSGGGFKVAAGALGLSQAAGALSKFTSRAGERAAGRIGTRLGDAGVDAATMERLLRMQVMERPGLRDYAGIGGVGATSPLRGGLAGALAPRSDPPKRKKKKGR
jgi:hypothetical protein